MKRLLGISHHTIFFTQYYTNVFFFSVETLYYLCQFFSAPKFLRKIETLEDDDLHLSPHPRSFFFLASAFFMSLSLGGEVAPSMLLRYRAHSFGGARIYPTWVSIFRVPKIWQGLLYDNFHWTLDIRNFKCLLGHFGMESHSNQAIIHRIRSALAENQ